MSEEIKKKLDMLIEEVSIIHPPSIFSNGKMTDGKENLKSLINQYFESLQSENKRLMEENERLTKQNKFFKTAGENLVEDNRSHQNEINRLRESLKTGEDANYKLIDKVRLLREELEEARNKLYESLPSGSVDAFELLKLVEIHIKRLDVITSKHKDL